MSRQLDEPGFDHANDAWVGARPGWDRMSGSTGSEGRQGEITFSDKQPAPLMDRDEFRLVFARVSQGGLSMTYDDCLRDLRAAGHEQLTLDHVALVAELTGIRGPSRQWTKVPAALKSLGATLGAKHKRNRPKR